MFTHDLTSISRQVGFQNVSGAFFPLFVASVLSTLTLTELGTYDTLNVTVTDLSVMLSATKCTRNIHSHRYFFFKSLLRLFMPQEKKETGISVLTTNKKTIIKRYFREEVAKIQFSDL